LSVIIIIIIINARRCLYEGMLCEASDMVSVIIGCVFHRAPALQCKIAYSELLSFVVVWLRLRTSLLLSLSLKLSL